MVFTVKVVFPLAIVTEQNIKTDTRKAEVEALLGKRTSSWK